VYLEHTPVETWQVAGQPVFVKREDLFAGPPAPPLGKLRGVQAILSKIRRDGKTIVGCFQATRSRIGHALAAACANMGGFECIVAYGAFPNIPPPPSALEAERLGARLLPIRNNFLTICHRQAQKHVEAEGGWMFPFGGELDEGIRAVASEAASLPPSMVERGTIVVPCGSGVTLAGVVRGLRGNPARIIGVSSGRGPESIRRCLIRNNVRSLAEVEIRSPNRIYREPENIAAPFPCDAYYDLKAWQVLTAEIDSYTLPILFWNVAG
jgi:1-aminocyclopropane-1-carboxylate deaminase/D-cysteine desulfhydrase-like pyridoxal-dependent ACC family enzyme